IIETIHGSVAGVQAPERNERVRQPEDDNQKIENNRSSCEMSLLSGVSSYFGLDIGTTGIRLVELRGTGATKTLVKYAYVPLDGKLSQSDSKADQQKLGQ